MRWMLHGKWNCQIWGGTVLVDGTSKWVLCKINDAESLEGKTVAEIIEQALGQVPEGCKIVEGLATPNYVIRSEWIKPSLSDGYWRDYYGIRVPALEGYSRSQCNFYAILLYSDGTVFNSNINSDYSTGEVTNQKRASAPSWPKLKYLCIAVK